MTSTMLYGPLLMEYATPYEETANGHKTNAFPQPLPQEAAAASW